MAQIDETLYDAFGQRQVSVIFSGQNQYHVVMEVAPDFRQSPEILNQIYVNAGGSSAGLTQASQLPPARWTASPPHRMPDSTAPPGGGLTFANAPRNVATDPLRNAGHGSTSGSFGVVTSQQTQVPLAAFSRVKSTKAPHAIRHQNLFAAATISFNVAPGVPLSRAAEAINDRIAGLGMPASIHGSFEGTAKVFQESVAREPLLIVAALVAVYIVLGVLYESFVHPLTILSSLPSAGVGAVLALLAANTEFTLITLIGVILLIGIVKKNAIMMIDYALHAQRTKGLPPREAIYQASITRFRPIMMTTIAAILGAVPLTIGFGEGAELRRPLGISIIGGLAISQILTLYTTPVIYLCFDRSRMWAQKRWRILLLHLRRNHPSAWPE
jgi:multidrug efflux pump